MNRCASLLLSAALAAAVASCGTPPGQQQPKAAPPAPRPAPGQTGLVPQVAVPEPNVPKYEAKGRRDPFTVVEPVAGSGAMTVAAAKLTGIVRGKETLALVETQDGIGYILKTGDTLFDGRVVEIGSDSIVFAVKATPGSPTPNRVVLRLAAN